MLRVQKIRFRFNTALVFEQQNGLLLRCVFGSALFLINGSNIPLLPTLQESVNGYGHFPKEPKESAKLKLQARMSYLMFHSL